MLSEKSKDGLRLPGAQENKVLGEYTTIKRADEDQRADGITGLSRRVWALVGGCLGLMLLSRAFSCELRRFQTVN
jgi:hypothetical protein